MSSSDRAAKPRRSAVAAAFVALVALGGCTVQPLYGDRTSSIGTPSVTPAMLASVEVAPVGDRVSQEVRNHLIFLLGGGSGPAKAPVYRIELGASAFASSGPTIETKSNTLEPSSGIMNVRSAYRLTEIATGTIVSSGVRSVQAAYDIPAQEFAALRARRNAEDRAARELSELLRLVIAQELQKPTSRSVPEVISSPEELAERDKPGEPASF
jgi:LPS-assembly lipoprotein